MLMRRDINEYKVNIGSEINVLDDKIDYTKDLAYSANLKTQERTRNSKKPSEISSMLSY